MLRKTSLFLRVGLISLLLFLALETLKHTSDFPEPLFVLVDSSESMKIEENGFKADEPGQLPDTVRNVILQQFPDREIHAYDLFHFEKIQRMIEIGDIEIAPLAFMRGRTLKNSFAILDEAQNASLTQIKMFLTRIGENSKIVINGDPSQIDLMNKNQSGLTLSLIHISEPTRPY